MYLVMTCTIDLNMLGKYTKMFDWSRCMYVTGMCLIGLGVCIQQVCYGDFTSIMV